MTLSEIYAEITALKMLLNQSDYKDMKLVEAIAQGEDISEFSAIMEKRQEWRDKINEYEAMIENDEYEPEPEHISEAISEPEQIESAEPIDGDIVFDMNVEED